LDRIVAQVTEGLGVSDPVRAEFYKLLVYEPGSFFVGHRDTEKAPGMFATLLVVLPSSFEGGELLVCYQGREAWPKTYGLDAILVPATRTLLDPAMPSCAAAMEKLRTACLVHLGARVAEPLAPPTDWARRADVSCRCPRCSELTRFLADPERRTWVFKAAEADRRHVEDTIKGACCDVDVTTDRRGRPYSLVCAKNQASYERRAKQRAGDLKNLARLAE